MLQTMIKQRQESARMYDEAAVPIWWKQNGGNRIIQQFLPEPLSEAEVEARSSGMASTGRLGQGYGQGDGPSEG